MSTVDGLLRDIHDCPGGLTCRPGRGVLYPKPFEGKLPPGGSDILLLGWNPRALSYHRDAKPDFATWRADAEASLAADIGEVKPLLPVLPATHGLASGRVLRTHLWKWPTRIKTGGGESAFYAQRCMASHFDAELALLRPRVVLTFHTEAADEMARRAEALGLEVRAHEAVRSSEARGWCLSSDAWGWPMGLVLVKDVPESGYHANTLAWARKAVAHLLDATRRA